jgi:hypothetical protein
MPTNTPRTRASDKRAERVEADLVALEKQVAKALRAVGKVSLPKKQSTMRHSVTVRSAAGEYLSVTVQQERRSGFSPDDRYSIRVEGAQDADFRSKHRTRDFNGFAAKVSEETLAPVVACVAKHLAVKDAAAVERAERDAEREKREKLGKKLDAHLRAIGKRHGIGTSYRDDELMAGNLRVRRQHEGYAVDITQLSEPDLERVLNFWRETFPTAE